MQKVSETVPTVEQPPPKKTSEKPEPKSVEKKQKGLLFCMIY